MDNNQSQQEVVNQEEIEILKSKIRKIPDFPKPGILFYDLFSILNQVDLTQILFNNSIRLIEEFLSRTQQQITAVVGLESRGFLLGCVISDRLKVPFVPARKKNKLPGAVHKINYTTEYSQDTLELQVGALDENSKVLVIDDLLATGGSMRAAEDLIKMSNSSVAGYFAVFEIEIIQGKNNLSNPQNFLSLIKI